MSAPAVEPQVVTVTAICGTFLCGQKLCGQTDDVLPGYRKPTLLLNGKPIAVRATPSQGILKASLVLTAKAVQLSLSSYPQVGKPSLLLNAKPSRAFSPAIEPAVPATITLTPVAPDSLVLVPTDVVDDQPLLTPTTPKVV
jgi:hypothetical protein